MTVVGACPNCPHGKGFHCKVCYPDLKNDVKTPEPPKEPHPNEARKARWVALRDQFLKDLDALDKDTPWSVGEPQWWLDMTAAQNFLIKQRQDIAIRDNKKDKPA